MESLFGSEAARKRKTLPPAMRRLIVDLKAEHPGLNRNEISRVCYVRFGRRPAHLSALAAAARFRWPAEDL